MGLSFRFILVVTPSATLGYPLRLGSVLASQLFTEFTEFYNVYMLNVVSEFTSTTLDVGRNDIADRAIGESHYVLLSVFKVDPLRCQIVQQAWIVDLALW